MVATFEPLPGNRRWSVKLRRLAKTLATFRPAFLRITEMFWAREIATFALEGPGWPALVPSTLAYKVAQGYSPKILGARTGNLKRSLTGPSGGYHYYGRWSMFVGTNVPYAKYHQFGMGNNPERLLVNITEATALLWGEVLQEYLDRANP